MTVASKTPPPDRLRGFLLGTLSPDDLESVESWVEADPASVGVLSTIRADDAVTRALQEPARSSAAPGDSDSAIDRIRAAFDSGIGPSPEADAGATPGWVPARTQPSGVRRFGDYRVVREIGRGGMGVVYEAFDDELHRPVAVKVLRTALADSPEYRERFYREARIAASIGSDHVVAVHRVGEADGEPYLAMELLPGSNLEDWLRAKRGVPTPPEVAGIVRGLLAGLAAAHAKGLIHRDIKPSNLWIQSPTSRLVVLDFGLARSLGDSAALTRPGAAMGTPEYMAPEQANGQTTGPQADLFSVGGVLYRIFAGRPPFERDDRLSTLTAMATVDLRPHPSIPAPVWGFVRTLMARSPSDRPADAAAALAEWEAVEPLYFAEPAPRLPGPRSPWKFAAGSAGFVLALLAVVVIAIAIRDRDEKPAASVPEVKAVAVGPMSPEVGAPPKPVERPEPRAVAKEPKEFGPGSSVAVVSAEQTQTYADESGSVAVGFARLGDRGTVVEFPPSEPRCLVRWGDGRESWVARECLKVE